MHSLHTVSPKEIAHKPSERLESNVKELNSRQSNIKKKNIEFETASHDHRIVTASFFIPPKIRKRSKTVGLLV